MNRARRGGATDAVFRRSMSALGQNRHTIQAEPLLLLTRNGPSEIPRTIRRSLPLLEKAVGHDARARFARK
jgi:hypothetical protein